MMRIVKGFYVARTSQILFDLFSGTATRSSAFDLETDLRDLWLLFDN
jgi:hypothetical protein